MTPLSPAARGPWRFPLAVWIVVAVVAIHLLFFWLVSNKHFLPKTRYVPPPPTPNFGARRVESVDPLTGEHTTRTDFVISTKLATPVPRTSPTPTLPP